jgi:hypothetical protein
MVASWGGAWVRSCDSRSRMIGNEKYESGALPVLLIRIKEVHPQGHCTRINDPLST